MSLLLAGMSGALFGAGLLLSGMADAARVHAFLDVRGAWDPSLLLVMGTAIAVFAAVVQHTQRRGGPWLDQRFHLPTRRDIDPKLVVGAAVFGVGWGLVGLCPGAALVSLAGGGTQVVVFVVAMLVGMKLVALAGR